MAVVESIKTITSPPNIRQFDVRKDLCPVADLVELCFADTLDSDGRTYIQRMRSASEDPAYLRWAWAVGERTNLPSSGLVWEEDGKVIGNLTLIGYPSWRQPSYLIANVAVHPDYRRRGIARQLTKQSIQVAKNKGAASVWLHVRQDNDPAIWLYQSLGFIERTRRTTWELKQDIVDPLVIERNQNEHTSFTIGKRLPSDWIAQKKWLAETYPGEINWNLSVKHELLAPGLRGLLARFWEESHVRQWSVRREGILAGVLSWYPISSSTDTLWLAVDPHLEDGAVFALLSHAASQLYIKRAISLDFPTGRATTGFTQAGFTAQQTLVWMQIKFQEAN